MLLKGPLKSVLTNYIMFPMVYSLLGLHKTPQHFFTCVMKLWLSNTHAETVDHLKCSTATHDIETKALYFLSFMWCTE